MSELFKSEQSSEPPNVLAMRKPCACGNEIGYIQTAGGQDCVRCTACNKFQYNAPRIETGRAPRTTQTIHSTVKPATRYLVIEREKGRCECCGKRPDDKEGLHMAHLLSVADGLKQGLKEDILNSEENLAAFCAECNLGGGAATISLPLACAILIARKWTPFPPRPGGGAQ